MKQRGGQTNSQTDRVDVQAFEQTYILTDKQPVLKGFISFNAKDLGSVGQRAAKLQADKVGGLKKKFCRLAGVKPGRRHACGSTKVGRQTFFDNY